MLKITLDSQCIIYLFDPEVKTPPFIDELSEVVNFGFSRHLDLAITTRVEVDLGRDKDDGRKAAMLKKLGMFPVVGTVARWGDSKWGGGDVWVGKENEHLWSELQRIIFPGLLETDRRYKNKVSDIDHLVGHIINGRDIFVTNDTSITKKASTLKQSVAGLVVMNPKQCADYVKKDIEGQIPKEIVPEQAKEGYSSRAMAGTVTFDYSNNNGRFTIGNGYFAFETMWTTAGNKCIHAYNDPQSIASIALVTNTTTLGDIVDASKYDDSSRARTVNENEILLLKNINGCYAAIKVLNVIARDSKSPKHEITFEYIIQEDKTSSFKGLSFKQKTHEEAITTYAAHVIQIGGTGSRQVTKTAWLLTEHAYLDAGEYAHVGFNGPADVMGLSPKEGFRITKCYSPSGNKVLQEPGYPSGGRIIIEDKLKNEVIIECEKSF